MTMVLKRAYSVLTLKSVDDDAREITGIASTPTIDSMGDIVEPKGAEFTLPLPLLWQHSSSAPIGHVTHAKVTKDGIEIKATIAKSDGALKQRLDEAWENIKLGLVRGLSIGFSSIEHAYMETGGIHFMRWAWRELSAVTIPANAECDIQTIRSLSDTQRRAASGQKSAHVAKLAGVAAPKTQAAKEATDMTLKEQIAAFQAKRAAAAARMEAMMTKAGEAGSTLEAEEQEEYDGLEADIEAIDKHLVRLEKLEKTQIAKATTIVADGVDPTRSGSQQRAGVVTVKDNLPVGVEFARYAICIARANGDPGRAFEIARLAYPDQPRIQNVLKAAIAGGSTTHITWASPLVQVDTSFIGDFVAFLRPRTILGRFGEGGIPSLRRVPFNVSVPGQTSGGTGYWVGEGAPKPVTKFDFGRTTVPFAKVANIAVLTEELVRFSNPSAEILVRDALAECLIAKLDVDFVDPAKAISAGVSPASVTNGATPVVATGYTAAKLRTDVVTLIKKFIAAKLYLGNGVWIMGSELALNIANMTNSLGQPEFPTMSMQGGTFNGLPVIVSDHVATVNQGSPTIPRPIMILVDAQEIWLADDGNVSIDVSREAALQMDTAPTNTPVGLGASPNAPTATSMVSMFQTNSVAIRAEREINWLKRRTEAAQYISNASYSA